MASLSRMRNCRVPDALNSAGARAKYSIVRLRFPMKILNRAAIIVIPKQPFVDWINFADAEGDELTLEEVREDATIYLVPETDGPEHISRVLHDFCRSIFEEQLASWIPDDTLWPIDRSFDVFCRWFAVSSHGTVIDLSPEPLVIEDL